MVGKCEDGSLGAPSPSPLLSHPQTGYSDRAKACRLPILTPLPLPLSQNHGSCKKPSFLGCTKETRPCRKPHVYHDVSKHPAVPKVKPTKAPTLEYLCTNDPNHPLLPRDPLPPGLHTCALNSLRLWWHKRIYSWVTPWHQRNITGSKSVLLNLWVTEPLEVE